LKNNEILAHIVSAICRNIDIIVVGGVFKMLFQYTVMYLAKKNI